MLHFIFTVNMVRLHFISGELPREGNGGMGSFLIERKQRTVRKDSFHLITKEDYLKTFNRIDIFNS